MKTKLNKLILSTAFLFACNLLLAQVDFNKRPDDDLGNNEDEFQELFFEGIKQKGIENYQKSIDALLKAKSVDDSKTIVYYELGKNYNALKNFGAAEEVLKEAVSREPSNEWYLDELYQVYINQDDIGRAVKTVKQLVQYHPDYKQDLVALYIRAKEFKDALKLLDELDAEFGINPDRDYLRNQVYTLTGNDKERIENLVERLEKNPDIENNYLTLIYRYSELGEKDKAFNVAKQLLQRKPNSQIVHLALYKFYLDDGETDKAINSMKIVLKSSDINPDAKTKVLSDFVKFVEDNPEYESDLMEATAEVDEGGGDSKTAKELAQYYLKANEKEKALEYFLQALNEEPDDFAVLKDVLLLQLDVKQYEEARQRSESALELYPAQPILYLINGVANNGLQKPKEAIEMLETGLDYLIDNPKMEMDFYKQLSVSYKAVGNNGKALMYAKKAEEIQKSNQ